jgi:hypothetical protein
MYLYTRLLKPILQNINIDSLQLQYIHNPLLRQEYSRIVSKQTTQMLLLIAQVPRQQMRILSNYQALEGLLP